MTLRSHLRSVAEHNARTLRKSPLAELSGSLGDLGTLLPLMTALTLGGSSDLGATLVFSGLANIVTGIVFGTPLPVQPMKAIAAIAIAQRFSKEETMAAGLTVAAAVFILSATGLLRWLHRVVPISVVRGIQVGAGLSLVISAGSSLLRPLSWVHPSWDNRIWALFAFLFLVVATLLPRVPYALVVFVVGIIVAAVVPSEKYDRGFKAGLWHPSTVVPSGPAWRVGAIEGALPQLPLTTLNSILAVTSLAASLFPHYPPAPSTTSLGFSVAIANLVGCWFGAMPVCHGSGGLAGQYRFGARSGASVIILGLVKVILGALVGEAIIPLLHRFPKSLLGIMVLAAGVELAKVAQSVGDEHDLWEQADDDADGSRRSRGSDEDKARKWMVMLVTVAGCLAFKNDAVGFIAGLVWHWSSYLPDLFTRLKGGRRRIRLGTDQDGADESLLRVNHDAPDGRTS